MSQVPLSTGQIPNLSSGTEAGSGDNSTHRICDDPTKRWEIAWLWLSERVNPIVVKEVRQSLKSRQFTISFGLTLIVAIGWTILGISVMVPRIYYMPAGLPLLAGFFSILNLPLMVIIPFGTFRSLASETDDSTFELLSISALSAKQIVYGKMASACVQIVLYLSALVPSIVLTYLLRGVGLGAILFFLGLTIAFSIFETALALLLAAIASTRMIQNLTSVAALAGLLMGFFIWTTYLLSAGLTDFGEGILIPNSLHYLFVLAVTSILLVALSLILRAAAAAIDFPSENNSSPLRTRIILLTTLTLFWSMMALVAFQVAEPATVMCYGMAIVLSVFGALMTGERGVISPRAQRGLPKTFAGRVFMTWFYPGAGLGYIYILSLYAAVVVTLIVFDIYFEYPNALGDLSIVIAGCYCWCFMAIYLGLNRLLMMMIPKQMPGRMLGAVTLLAVTMLFTHLLPLLVAYYTNNYGTVTYAWHQSANVLWTLIEADDRRTFNLGTSTILITLCAVGIFGLNLLLSMRDVLLVRIAEPPRVLQESENEVATKASDSKPASPFDSQD